jgi:hypothetical protein
MQSYYISGSNVFTFRTTQTGSVVIWLLYTRGYANSFSTSSAIYTQITHLMLSNKYYNLQHL